MFRQTQTQSVSCSLLTSHVGLCSVRFEPLPSRCYSAQRKCAKNDPARPWGEWTRAPCDPVINWWLVQAVTKRQEGLAESTPSDPESSRNADKNEWVENGPALSDWKMSVVSMAGFHKVKPIFSFFFLLNRVKWITRKSRKIMLREIYVCLLFRMSVTFFFFDFIWKIFYPLPCPIITLHFHWPVKWSSDTVPYIRWRVPETL